jgi:hypothetical protein
MYQFTAWTTPPGVLRVQKQADKCPIRAASYFEVSATRLPRYILPRPCMERLDRMRDSAEPTRTSGPGGGAPGNVSWNVR